MEFEYDPDKDEINLKKHGLPLMLGHLVFSDLDHIVIRLDPTHRRRGSLQGRRDGRGKITYGGLRLARRAGQIDFRKTEQCR